MTIEEAEKVLRAVSMDELGSLNYGEGTCTSWEEHREEHEEADEDEKPDTTYSMICGGAERVRQRTKNNPGSFDCYANAEPDEPMFVLLARDEDAPERVRDWAKRRESKGDYRKAAEALEVAAAMEKWRIGKFGR